eukprot:scaffold5771_cov171-Amphora_coffeaeformis.AAC.20
MVVLLALTWAVATLLQTYGEWTALPAYSLACTVVTQGSNVVMMAHDKLTATHHSGHRQRNTPKTEKRAQSSSKKSAKRNGRSTQSATNKQK